MQPPPEPRRSRRPSPGGPLLTRLALVLALLLLSSEAVQAQDPPPCDRALEVGLDTYLAGRFEEARTMLQDCLARGAFSEAQKPDVYKLLVRIYDADGLEEQVKRFLAELLSLVPEYEPNPDDPPSFVQLVEQYRRETNLAPVARFMATPPGGVAPLVVRFDASESSDPDGTVASYTWDFGDGGSAAGVTAEHTYESAGVFTVRLTIADDLEALGRASFAISVASPPNQSPVARFTATPNSGDAPLTVRLDASGSTDADGDIASFLWDFGDGETGAGATAAHAYDSAGSYTTTLTVIDDDGAENRTSAGITVTAAPAPPTARTGGGLRKWLLIGGGTALAGTAGIVLFGGGDGGGNGDTVPIPLPPGRPGSQ